MKHFAAGTILMCLCLAVGKAEGPSAKTDMINRLASMVLEINKAITDGRFSLEKERNEPLFTGVLPELVSRIKKPNELAQLAVICRVLSWKGENPEVEMAFEKVFWICVARISKQNDRDAVSAMLLIERHSNLDAGDALRFKEYRQEQISGARSDKRK